MYACVHACMNVYIVPLLNNIYTIYMYINTHTHTHTHIYIYKERKRMIESIYYWQLCSIYWFNFNASTLYVYTCIYVRMYVYMYHLINGNL